ncbi:MAG: ATP-binding protein [Desulfobacterales bacterium]|jgi:PAS domain S-box-containing protein|nr:ATP-binding protein [Desulfobacterales bacterium]
MSTSSSVITIGLVGGGELCAEILQKTTSVSAHEEFRAPIVAVADPEPTSPGMALAGRLGLATFTDYRQLYEARQGIDLIIILTPEPGVFENILATRPARIRILSYPVFQLFWQAIGREEQKLRERTREMETLVNGIQDFILVITPDMSIIEANEAFLQKMGLSRDQVIGRKCYQIYRRAEHPCNKTEDECPLRLVVQNQRHIRRIQKRHLPDGEVRYYEVSIYPLYEKEGKVSKFIHISRDITQHRREEEEITRRLEQMVEDRTRQLRETHEKLLHQDRMSSLGKLAATVVHEINNPIAGILNLVMLMKRISAEQTLGAQEIEQFRRYLDLMETETRRTSRIVSNLLAFSRQPIAEKQRVNIPQIIEQTLLINANLLKIAGAGVDRRLEPGMPEVIGSEDQLQQVFMNLFSNAAEAMEAKGGGTLRIEAAHEPDLKAVAIRVVDTGVGVPAANMPRLFEPFFTTKKKGQGVGLGLSVAYGIIQEHGGTISAQSVVGEGTTFTIRLPAVGDADRRPAGKGVRHESQPDTDRR